MASADFSNVSWLTATREVVLLQWPADAVEAQRLVREGVPHLLLVADGETPPVTGACLQDWLSLPAADAEIRARMLGLAQRAANHQRVPHVDELGHLSHRGRSVFLSPTDQRLAHALIERFREVVAERDLIEAVWPEGATNQALRVHISRLRHRIVPIGLNVKCVRSSGYVMTDGSDEHQHTTDALAQ
jgi:two-component system, OmpR family, response regulator